MNPLQSLKEFGQSVWLDYIRRGLLESGELERLVREDGVRGVTSNPAIFEKAISGSTDYAGILPVLARESSDAKIVYEKVAVRDIQDAADVLRPVYDESKGGDGFVSLEVSPALARKTEETVEEARRLWKNVARPNLMIKVPATAEGMVAIEKLISEGINVNVTLIFAQDAYARVTEAYIAGLEKRLAAGGDLAYVASVASFFVSRIDSAVDSRLEELAESADAEQSDFLKALMGKVAIANAKQAYRSFGKIFSGERWETLAEKGARKQRLLWASTGTKNPAYSDVLYVEELIGAETVNTIPPATLDAFREHGKPRESLTESLDEADATMEGLKGAGVSLEEITDRLLDDGVRLFEEPFNKLLAAIEKNIREAPASRISRMTYTLPDDLGEEVAQAIHAWQKEDKVRRLWEREAALWTGADEAKWLGWLGIAGEDGEYRAELNAMAAQVRKKVREAGFSSVLLLGMGGSSLCPEVLAATFGAQEGFPKLHVLDSTDPAQVLSFERRIDLSDSFFVVSSKSGSTLEPNILKEYFFGKVKEAVGKKEAGSRFIAITDPGSKLQEIAERDGFRKVRFGIPSVGGRYSALTNFGMVPAALMGIDVGRFLDRTDEMVQACTHCVPAADNPGVVLGAILGVLAKRGRDKVTLVASPGIAALGSWLEQLLAESTGKQEAGLIPVDEEQVAPANVYGEDRVFVYTRLSSAPDTEQDAAIDKLEADGQPVVCIEMEEIYDLGQEFFRWEIATAVAGAIIGINPFDQPDVEASKVETRKLTEAYEKKGALPGEQAFFEDQGIRLFADDRNAAQLKEAAGEESLAAYLRAHLDRLAAKDYFALLAFIEMREAHRTELQRVRHAVRDAKKVATCLGFGPRFLHSTGQAYKGGPKNGVFLQITCDDAEDVPVPGRKVSFGIVKAAQARGDFQVLAERKRRILRVHLGKDVAAGLERLREAVEFVLE